MNPKTLSTLMLAATVLAGCQSRSHHPEVVDETYVHRYGVQVPQEDWTSRGKHGKVISKMMDGVTVSRNYTSGELDGDTTYTFPHSEQVEIIHTYVKGELLREVSNYRIGTPRKEIIYLGGNRHKVSEWYENGAARSIEEYDGNYLVKGEYFNEGQQLEARIDSGEGVRYNRDAYGQLTSTDEIHSGELAMRTTYHPNGAPKEMIPYSGGTIQGKKRTFHPAGEPETVEEWRSDEQHGVTTCFENGEKVSELPYVHGQRNGIEQVYRDGNSIVERRTWKNDQLHGPTYHYVGDKTTEEWYYHGRKVTKATYDRMSRAQVK